MKYSRNELDRYSQDERKKTLGYEQGRSCKFLDGRILRNVEYLAYEIPIATIPPNAVINLVLNFQTPKDRATYFDFITLDVDDGLINFPLGVFMAAQIWANGNRIFSATAPTSLCPIGVYVPPSSAIQFCLLVSNFPNANPYYVNLEVKALRFSAFDDIWEFGEGSGLLNPGGFPV